MKFYHFIFLAFLVCACSSSKKGAKGPSDTENKAALDFSDGPPTIIYKTRKDYSNRVAVGLSEDKSEIISYPHPHDVFYNERLAYPSELRDGYLLDNQGVGMNSAFLNITLKEYSKLEEAPSLEELYKAILDKYPFTQFCKCGNRAALTDEVNNLNVVIESGNLKWCECLVKE